jgi:hypothetical protein
VNLVASVRSLSSRWVAWAFAATYLVVSAAVGVVLLATPKTELNETGNPATYLSGDTPPSPDVMAKPAPAGFQWVDGPEGLETVVPAGWQSVEAGAPGAMRAVDPSAPGRIVGFGGAVATSEDIVQTHIAYEERFAARTTDYRRLGLNSATYGGHKAVEWEFLHNDGGGVQRVHSLYWLVDGVEYFVFVSGPADQWTQIEPVYDAMVANSRP